MLSKSIIGLFLATVFACQDNRNVEFNHPKVFETKNTDRELTDPNMDSIPLTDGEIAIMFPETDHGIDIIFPDMDSLNAKILSSQHLIVYEIGGQFYLMEERVKSYIDSLSYKIAEIKLQKLHQANQLIIINDKYYCVDDEVSNYIDSLKTKVHGE